MPFSREQQVIADRLRSLTELIPVIETLEKQCAEKATNAELLTNTVYVCRKSVEILDELKKSLNALSAKQEEQISMLLASGDERKYSTEYCTVSPNPSFYVRYPTGPEKEGFEEFAKQLPLIAMRPHYPTMEKLIAESISCGAGLPFGLKKELLAGTTLKLRVTSKKAM